MSTKIVLNKSTVSGQPILSDEACALYESITGQAVTDGGRSIPRHDPALVAVVEQLGDEAGAWGGDGGQSELAVVQIAGRVYRIESEDCGGYAEEFVVEPSDLDWIEAR